MGLYEHKGLDIYKTHDYYECRELIDIASTGKQIPEDRLQELANERFNMFLDEVAYNKFKWLHIPQKKNLWQIKAVSAELLNQSVSNPENNLDGILPV